MAWRGDEALGGIRFDSMTMAALHPHLPLVAVARPDQANRTTFDTVCLWDAGLGIDPGRCDPVLEYLGAVVSGLAWSRDGSVLAVSIGPYGGTGMVTPETLLWDLEGGRVAGRVAGVWNPRFSPDGSLLITSGDPRADEDLHLFAVDPDLLLTPTATFSPTPSPTSTATASPSPSSTPTRTPRRTVTPTPSRSPSPVRMLLHLPWLERSVGP
jgi:WD40 repeat protein